METTKEPQNSKKNGTFWSGVFSFLDTVKLKKATTRPFIFRPPKNSGYTFEKVNETDYNAVYEFCLTNQPKYTLPEMLDLEAHKIYSNRRGRTYMIPLLYISHLNKNTENMIIYSHGNASDLALSYEIAILLAQTFNMNVIAYDYTGYGISPNRASEENTYDDLEDVLSYAICSLNYPIFKIFLWSFSLGCGPTIEIAVRYKYLSGVILTAPIASCLAWMDKDPSHCKDYKESDIYANIKKIDKIGTKIVILHGGMDNIVPVEHSRLLYEKASSIKEDDGVKAWLIIVENMDHDSVFLPFQIENSGITEQFIKYLNHLKKKVEGRVKKACKFEKPAGHKDSSASTMTENSGVANHLTPNEIEIEMNKLRDRFKGLSIDSLPDKSSN